MVTCKKCKAYGLMHIQTSHNIIGTYRAYTRDTRHKVTYKGYRQSILIYTQLLAHRDTQCLNNGYKAYRVT